MTFQSTHGSKFLMVQFAHLKLKSPQYGSKSYVQSNQFSYKIAEVYSKAKKFKSQISYSNC